MGRIRAILLRHVAEDPELGYCQGLNLVATVFAVASESQGQAYSRFRCFVKRVRGLWLPGFPLLELGSTQFTTAAQDRCWYKHLGECNVEVSMFLPQALLTMFTMWLPLKTVVHNLALPEKEGLSAMVAMTIAVLDHVSLRLIEERSMEGVLKALQHIQDDAPRPGVLEFAMRKTLPEVQAISLSDAALKL